MKNFAYYEPKSLTETFELQRQHQGSLALMAGGTDLINQMEKGNKTPLHVANLKTIDDQSLTEIASSDGQDLSIGSLVTVGEVENSSLVREKFPVLAQAAGVLGTVQVRNRGTVGGNICNASPAADMVPSLICLGAQAVIVGPQGERRVALEDFFTGPGQTVLGTEEVLTAIKIPAGTSAAGSVYLKHTVRKALDLAIVGVGATVALDPSSKACTSARIVLGAVASTPLLVDKAAQILVGGPLDDDRIQSACQAATEAAQPIDDLRSTAEYRKHMVGILVGRAVSQAAGLAS